MRAKIPAEGLIAKLRQKPAISRDSLWRNHQEIDSAQYQHTRLEIVFSLFEFMGPDMSERNFNMRMKTIYEGDSNTIARIEVDNKVDNQWQPLDLGLTTPGFDIFVYAVFTCQHMYFRVNCAERNLQLESAEGSIDIGTDNGWNMDTLRVHFTGELRSGQASPDDIDYIVSRMRQCPVSINLQKVTNAESTVILN